jgi:hypothetical protein
VREEIIGSARLILADCREVLPTLSGVDAVVTDPPYGIKHPGDSTRFSGGNTNSVSSNAPISLGLRHALAQDATHLQNGSNACGFKHHWPNDCSTRQDSRLLWMMSVATAFFFFSSSLIWRKNVESISNIQV